MEAEDRTGREDRSEREERVERVAGGRGLMDEGQIGDLDPLRGQNIGNAEGNR